MQVQKQRDNIVLIGSMGSGKSTVGKALARKFQVQFLQMDKRVEVRAKMNIKELITRYGEAEFRRRESRELKLLQHGTHRQIIEATAGVVAQESNHELLRALGWVIYLRADPDELFRRFSEDPSRPMLKAPDALDRFAKLHAEREPFYAKAAHSVLETTGISPSQLVLRVHTEAQKIAANRAAARNAAQLQLRPDPGDRGFKSGDAADVVMNIFDLFT